MVPPRFQWVPPRSYSLGADCIAFWKDAGGQLYEWQELVIDGMLGITEDERLASSNDGMAVARQNGKGVVLQAIEVFFAFELGYRVVMHTAHEFATSQEHQLRLEDFIQNCPHLHSRVRAKGGYVHANGQESIRLKSGVRIIFKARTKGGGRGYSGDLLVWDEAMVIPEVVLGAQRPMLRASQAPYGPKIIYAGSAVDQEVHEHGVTFARIRERGIAKAPGVCWFEWSAPYDHPSQMTDEDLRNRKWWTLANPSIEEGLISEEYMAEEIEGMTPRTAAVELACVGDWPRTDRYAEAVIDPKSWADLTDMHSQALDPVVVGFDVSPNRSRSCVVAAGFRADGLLHVEVLEHKLGTGWVAPYLAEFDQAHSPEAIVCDSKGPVASLVSEIEAHGVKVSTLKMDEITQACGYLFDAVERQALRHLGTNELLAAVRGGVKRPLGDAWAWSRKNSNDDITPIVASTVAVWYAGQHLSSVYDARGMVAV